MVLTLENVIQALESGCHPSEIAIDLRRSAAMAEAIGAGDAVLMAEQAALLRTCRTALDALLAAKPMLGAFNYGSDSLGNLRAQLYDFRPQGVFGMPSNSGVEGREMSEAKNESSE